MSDYKVLTEPLTAKDMDENGWVEGIAAIDTHELFVGFGPFLDVLSNALVGDDCLMDIDYRVVGFDGETTLHLMVAGDATMSFEIRE